MNDVLTAHQRAVVGRVILQEESKRMHLVVGISGAHAYGFPSPDSDVDLKAIHIEPAHRLLGLFQPTLHADRLEVIDGVEVDYTSNELHPVLLGVLQGNGNYIERILGSLSWSRRDELQELRPLVQRMLSRRLHRHYNGFGHSQFKALEGAEKPTAKKALYVLRTTLTGIHALRTGEIVPDVTQLLDQYGFAGARELIARKQSGERVELDPRETQHWLTETRRAFTLLDEARDQSLLPEEPPSHVELEAWLLDMRRRFA